MTADGAIATIPAMLDRALARRLRRTADQIATATADRERLIVEAHRAGASLREIAEHAGITHVAVMKLIRRHTKKGSTT
jgi:DNA-binding NarL/FixJ family response regulator